MPGIIVKTSWPEVVGMPDHQAVAIIHRDRRDVHTQVLYVGERLTPGYDGLRVRVIVNRDANLTVAQTPVVG